jgi:DNA repair ATPase RecN
VRYGIPAALVAAGLLFLAIAPDSSRLEGWALFTGAGLSVLLLNVLFRIGVQGEAEREREEAARAHFDETGRWPDDEAPAARQWRQPEGIVTPEMEAAERRRKRTDGQE